jgi:hypothetical protein
MSIVGFNLRRLSAFFVIIFAVWCISPTPASAGGGVKAGKKVIYKRKNLSQGTFTGRAVPRYALQAKLKKKVVTCEYTQEEETIVTFDPVVDVLSTTTSRYEMSRLEFIISDSALIFAPAWSGQKKNTFLRGPPGVKTPMTSKLGHCQYALPGTFIRNARVFSGLTPTTFRSNPLN